MDPNTGRLLRKDEVDALPEDERLAFEPVPDYLEDEARKLLAWRDHKREERRLLGEVKRKASRERSITKAKAKNRRRRKLSRR